MVDPVGKPMELWTTIVKKLFNLRNSLAFKGRRFPFAWPALMYQYSIFMARSHCGEAYQAERRDQQAHGDLTDTSGNFLTSTLEKRQLFMIFCQQKKAETKLNFNLRS